MKCSACGTESNADARFCSNCGAKLPREAGTPLAAASPPDLAGAAAPPAPAVETARRAPRAAGWLLLGAALVVGAYVVYRQLLPGEATPEGAATSAPAPPAVVPAAAPAPPPSRTTETEPAPMPSAAPVAETPPSPAAPARAAAPPRPAAKSRAAQPPPPPPQPVAAAPPPPPPPAPAPVVVAQPKPDRLQQLNEALARCKGRDLIGRAVCEQRSRLQYCDGYWDQVPQCSGVGKLNPAAN